MATVMVWKTNAFGSFRVTVERLSVNGMATLIKFTRDERYRPAEAGSDGTMWVASSTLHKTNPKAEAVAKRTAETLKGKRPTPAKKAAPRKAATATKSRTRTATAVQEF